MLCITTIHQPTNDSTNVQNNTHITASAAGTSVSQSYEQIKEGKTVIRVVRSQQNCLI